VLNELIRQLFNTLIPRSQTVGSVAYTVFVWSRLSAPVELLTHYTTPDTTVEIAVRVQPWNNVVYHSVCYCRCDLELRQNGNVRYA